MKTPNIFIVSVTVLACSLSLSLSSCVDDTFKPTGNTNDGEIHYAAGVAVGDRQSRSGRGDLYSEFSAKKMDNSNIYLLTAVEDDIKTNPMTGKGAVSADDVMAEMMSRATRLTDDNIVQESVDKEIEAYAYAYDSQYADYTAAFEAGAVHDYIINNHMKITNGTDGSLNLSPAITRYWPGKEYNMSFFAIFPSKEDYQEIVGGDYVVNFENIADPYIEPYVAAEIYNQQDVMVASLHCKGDGSDVNQVVPFQMKHIKAAVSVNLGTGFAGRRFKSIRFDNTHTKSRYLVASGTWDRQFLNEDNTTVEAVFSPDRAAVTSLKDDNNYFMMIPQHLDAASRYKLHESVRLTVVVYNPSDKTEETFTTELSGNWEEGKTYNYTLSTTPKQLDYIFTLETDELYFSYDGTPAGDGDKETVDGIADTDVSKLRVKSWVATTTTSGTTYAPVDWTAKLQDGGDATMFDNTATGYAAIPFATADNPSSYQIAGVTATLDNVPFNYSFKLKIKPSVKETITNAADVSFMTNKSLGSDSYAGRIDLSRYDAKGNEYKNSSNKGTRYSANSYIVNHPGYYKIPCVYGNGIYDNAGYPQAYKHATYNSNVYNSSFALKYLLRYDGEQIANYQDDNPWISWAASKSNFNKHYPGGDGSKKMHDTFVLWTDSSNGDVVKVANDGYAYKDGEEYYILFNVGVGSDIEPCNAVIEILNPESKVLWSYHIWVTPHTANDTFTCDANVVGTVGQSTFFNVPLGYVQGPTYHYPERVDTIILTQNITGNTHKVAVKQKDHTFATQSCTYYQWGRKDAFPGFEAQETAHLYIDQSYEVETKPRQCWGERNYSTSGVFTKLNNPDAEEFSNTIAYTCKTPTSSDDVPAGILNPLTFYTGYWWPINEYYWNLWGCQMNTVCDTADGVYPTADFGSTSIKTAYDPCPIGFKIPAVYAMPAITADGKNHTSEFSPITKVLDSEEDLYSKWINTSFVDHSDFMDYMGFKFYPNRMPSAGTKGSGDPFIMYAMGVIETQGTFYGMGGHGYYWCSTRWTSNHGSGAIYNSRGYYTKFGYGSGKSNFEPVFGNTITTYGMPIMPLKAMK